MYVSKRMSIGTGCRGSPTEKEESTTTTTMDHHGLEDDDANQQQEIENNNTIVTTTTTTTTCTTISQEGVTGLMRLLYERGYFLQQPADQQQESNTQQQIQQIQQQPPGHFVGHDDMNQKDRHHHPITTSTSWVNDIVTQLSECHIVSNNNSSNNNNPQDSSRRTHHLQQQQQQLIPILQPLPSPYPTNQNNHINLNDTNSKREETDIENDMNENEKDKKNLMNHDDDFPDVSGKKVLLSSSSFVLSFVTVTTLREQFMVRILGNGSGNNAGRWCRYTLSEVSTLLHPHLPILIFINTILHPLLLHDNTNLTTKASTPILPNNLSSHSIPNYPDTTTFFVIMGDKYYPPVPLIPQSSSKTTNQFMSSDHRNHTATINTTTPLSVMIKDLNFYYQNSTAHSNIQQQQQQNTMSSTPLLVTTHYLNNRIRYELRHYLNQYPPPKNDETTTTIATATVECGGGVQPFHTICENVFTSLSNKFVLSYLHWYLYQQEQVQVQQQQLSMDLSDNDTSNADDNDTDFFRLKYNNDGVLMIVSKRYLQTLRQDIITTIQSYFVTSTDDTPTSLTTPVSSSSSSNKIVDNGIVLSITQLAKLHTWDRLWLTEIIQEELEQQLQSSSISLLQGELFGDLFVSATYQKNEKQKVWNEFCTRGYVILTASTATISLQDLSSTVTPTVVQQPPYRIIPNSTVKEYIMDRFSEEENNDDDDSSKTPIVLSHLIVNPAIVLAPLRSAMQEAELSCNWVDISMYVAVELLEYDYLVNDLQSLIEKYILDPKGSIQKQVQPETKSKTKKKGKALGDLVLDDTNDATIEEINLTGVLCIRSPGGGLYLSHSLIETFTKSILPKFVEQQMKEKAKEMFTMGGGDMNQTERNKNNIIQQQIVVVSSLSGKEKNKIRREQEKNRQSNTNDRKYEVEEDHLIDVQILVDTLLGEYPDLAEVGNDKDHYLNLITMCCHEAFYTEELEEHCQKMLQNELNQLTTQRTQKSLKSSIGFMNQTNEGGKLLRDIQTAFEDPMCFATSCYFIQSLYKFLTYAEEHYPDIMNETSTTTTTTIRTSLREEILVGACADFTCRITQYALYKYNVNDHCFQFYQDMADDVDEEEERQKETYYYSPIDITKRRHKRGTYLSWNKEKQRTTTSTTIRNNQNPLVYLRDLLPGTVGVALARQWILCGGACYEGGKKEGVSNHSSSTTNDDQENVVLCSDSFTRPGDLDAFMIHVSEHCLPICGLPFTKLDKKSEKKFLAERRQLLVNQLIQSEYETDDPETILDLSIMLLYQVVKNIVVLGQYVRQPILRMLLKERKVSDQVKELLFQCNVRLENDETIDRDLLKQLKAACIVKLK